MKQKKLAIVSFSLLLSTIVMAQDLDGIKTMLDNERYSSAESILIKKITEQGTEPELNYLMVKVYLEQDKEQEAKRYVEQYQLNETGDKADPLNRIAYARYLLSTGEKAAALSVFEQVLLDKKNKKNPDILVAIAEAHIETDSGDAVVALDLLDEAAKKDKKNAIIDILKGNAYRKQKDASNAYLAYAKAIEKDPGNTKALYLLGNIFVGQKNAEVYMEYFNKVYTLDSTYAPVLEALYDHYYFRDVKKAKLYLEKFIENSDYSIQNDYRLTDLMYLNQEYPAAIKLAKEILEKQKDEAQPRLYKLIAYSLEATGDSAEALDYINSYFVKEEPAKLIAPDYELRARLAERQPGTEAEVIGYYVKAAELDSVAENKVRYAIAIAGLYKKLKDYSRQAQWLANVFNWKERSSNVDLFNWGLAHYNAGEYPKADTVFLKYTTEYPDNIFGHFWRAQVNAAIDTNSTEGLAIPHYQKVVDIGEKDKQANKTMLLKAYGYLGGYEANTTKNFEKSLEWFKRFNELDNQNEDILRYIGILEKWIDEGKGTPKE